MKGESTAVTHVTLGLFFCKQTHSSKHRAARSRGCVMTTTVFFSFASSDDVVSVRNLEKCSSRCETQNRASALLSLRRASRLSASMASYACRDPTPTNSRLPGVRSRKGRASGGSNLGLDTNTTRVSAGAASRHARASASRGRMSPSLPYADVTTTMSGAREEPMGGAGGASECSRFVVGALFLLRDT